MVNNKLCVDIVNIEFKNIKNHNVVKKVADLYVILDKSLSNSLTIADLIVILTYKEYEETYIEQHLFIDILDILSDLKTFTYITKLTVFFYDQINRLKSQIEFDISQIKFFGLILTIKCFSFACGCKKTTNASEMDKSSTTWKESGD
ncbi:hypothetical protein RFI_11025 [Reticulomyxa filosa]|uniref:Uncharacterized protein n=1 Tax=Reticulomyxa filosa TaxID=46433 RepID=X6NJD2_RETFI|nr:hypothetical protein RFI_11025 [Reticulomyxa filosa]|eukprot:ETO26111.1 hypothetical protein RFI_11025 [Reticulomyxa filosa]